MFLILNILLCMACNLALKWYRMYLKRSTIPSEGTAQGMVQLRGYQVQFQSQWHFRRGGGGLRGLEHPHRSET